jgi:hypothetical protein
MRKPRMKFDPMESAIDAEISRWPGVTAHREHGGKHYRLVLNYGGKSRFVTYPCTPSDWRGHYNRIGDIRKTLAELGAKTR